VHEELKRRGVTLMILREEHRAERADGRRDRAGICIVQAKVALSLSIAVPWTGAIRDHPIFDKLSADQARGGNKTEGCMLLSRFPRKSALFQTRPVG
jgi:hypothetical protein